MANIKKEDREKALQDKFLSIDDDLVEVNDHEEQDTPVKERAKRQKTYKDEDLIPCKSIVQGYLNFKGKKSDIVYQWEAVNDVTNVEYRDLKTAMLSRAVHVMRPYFIIEDENLINLPEWAEVKAIYDKMYSKSDLTEIFKIQSVDKMGQVLASLPEGVKRQMGSLAKEMMERGTLDSLRKIRKIDEVLGTDLYLLINEM